MKKLLLNILLASVTLLTASPQPAYPQKDSRKLPYYFDAEMSQKVPFRIHRGNRVVWYQTDTSGCYRVSNKSDKLQSTNGITMIKVTQGASAKSETHIASDPNNPDVIIGTSNDFRYNNSSSGYRMGAYYTADGGKTWENSTTQANMDLYIARPNKGSMTIFDPSIAFDSKGYAYYLYGYTAMDNQGDEGDNGVFVSRTRDGGKIWDAPFPIQVSYAAESNAFNDRFWCAMDHFANSPYKDRLYVTWQRFSENQGIVLQNVDAKDFDNENYPSIPTFISGGSTQSPNPAVGPNGELYIVWQQTASEIATNAMFTSSFDGGETFRGIKNLQTIYHSGTVDSYSGRKVFPDKQNIRVSGYPSIAVDCSGGKYNGRIYVVQAGKANSNTSTVPGVSLTYSDDKGISWTAGRKIDNNTNTDRDVFFPSIAVDESNGMIAILYYTSKDAENNSGLDAYVSISRDGGATFSNIRITDESYYLNNSSKVAYQGTGNIYWGDYTGITANNGKVYPLFWWCEDQNGLFWNLDCYTAVLSNMPAPPVLIASGTNIPVNYLSWSNPAKNLFGEELKDYAINVYREEQIVATLPAGTTYFEDTNAIDGTTYTYYLQTLDNETGKTSDKVAATILTGGVATPQSVSHITFEPVADGVRLSWINPKYHTDNTILHDLDAVEIYKDGTILDKYSTKVAGDTVSTIVKPNLDAFSYLTLQAVATRNGISTAGDTTGILVFAGATHSEFKENFDAGAVTPYNTNAAWAVTSSQYKSPEMCLTDSPEGNYKSNTITHITFAPTEVTAEAHNLTFVQKALIDYSSNDYAIVFVSDDNMQTWQTLCSFNSSTYPDDWLLSSADSSKWVTENRSLKDYVGKNIYIRFLIDADNLRIADGWYIDDVAINNNESKVGTGDRSTADFSFDIFPNPVENIATIRLTGNVSENNNTVLRIYDSLGQLLSTSALSNFANPTVDLSGYSSGTYFIGIEKDGQTVVKPVSLNK